MVWNIPYPTVYNLFLTIYLIIIIIINIITSLIVFRILLLDFKDDWVAVIRYSSMRIK